MKVGSYFFDGPLCFSSSYKMNFMYHVTFSSICTYNYPCGKEENWWIFVQHDIII
jgi:hypothetical protein